MTTTTAADGEALLRGILEDPDDDAVRLVYADWLEDNGEHGRADAIRAALTPIAVWPQSTLRLWRESEVIGPDHTAIFTELVARRNDKDSAGGAGRGGFGYRISRGMLSEITMPLAAFLKHAESLFRRHPITAVRLSDRVSSGADNYFRWFVTSPEHGRRGDRMFGAHEHWLPSEVGWLLRGAASVTSEVTGEIDGAVVNRHFYYQTAKEAEDALSRACVAYGRKLAGLPPLKGTEHE